MASLDLFLMLHSFKLLQICFEAVSKGFSVIKEFTPRLHEYLLAVLLQYLVVFTLQNAMDSCVPVKLSTSCDKILYMYSAHVLSAM